MTSFTVPANLEELGQQGQVDFDVLLPLAVEPANVTLFACQQCRVPRPYFCIYDTRDRPEFAHDWTCESCVAAVKRNAENPVPPA